MQFIIVLSIVRRGYDAQCIHVHQFDQVKVKNLSQKRADFQRTRAITFVSYKINYNGYILYHRVVRGLGTLDCLYVTIPHENNSILRIQSSAYHTEFCQKKTIKLSRIVFTLDRTLGSSLMSCYITLVYRTRTQRLDRLKLLQLVKPGARQI